MTNFKTAVEMLIAQVEIMMDGLDSTEIEDYEQYLIDAKSVAKRIEVVKKFK